MIFKINITKRVLNQKESKMMTRADLVFLYRMQDFIPKEYIEQYSAVMVSLEKAYDRDMNASWEADNLRGRERYDSYGQFDGYYP